MQLLKGPGSLLPLFLVLTGNSAAPKTFRLLNDAIFGDGSSKGVLSTLGRHVETLSEQLGHVRSLFDTTSRLSADRIVPQIRQLLERGQFESRLSSDANGQRSMFFEKSLNNPRVELGHVKLQDLLKGSTVFRRENAKPEDRAKVDEFVAIVQCAEEIHSTRLQLEALGYWPIRQRSYNYPEDFGLHLDYFKRELKALTTLLQRWRSAVEAARQQEPRLLFFSAAALGQFSGAIERLVRKKDVPSCLAPFLWMCFPEFVGANVLTGPAKDLNATLLTGDVVGGALAATAKALGDKLKVDFSKNSVDPVQVILLVQQFTTDLHTHIKHKLSEIHEDFHELSRRCGVKQEGEARKFVFPDESTPPIEIFKALVALLQQEPHPSLILNCSSETLSDDVSRFIAAAKNFRYLPFTIIGVNSLQPDIRQRLLADITGVVDFNLALIFIGDCGVFTDLPDITPAEVRIDLPNLRQALNGNGMRQLRNIKTCQVPL